MKYIYKDFPVSDPLLDELKEIQSANYSLTTTKKQQMTHT